MHDSQAARRPVKVPVEGVGARTETLVRPSRGPLIEDILSHLPSKPEYRCYDVVHKSLLWIPRLNPANGCLAIRTDFELRAVHPHETECAQPATPIIRISSELDPAVPPVILYP